MDQNNGQAKRQAAFACNCESARANRHGGSWQGGRFCEQVSATCPMRSFAGHAANAGRSHLGANVSGRTDTGGGNFPRAITRRAAPPLAFVRADDRNRRRIGIPSPVSHLSSPLILRPPAERNKQKALECGRNGKRTARYNRGNSNGGLQNTTACGGNMTRRPRAWRCAGDYRTRFPSVVLPVRKFWIAITDTTTNCRVVLTRPAGTQDTLGDTLRGLRLHTPSISIIARKNNVPQLRQTGT